MTVLLVLFFMMPGFWPSLPTDTLTLDAAREAATLRFQERGQQGIYADLTALQLQDLGAGRLPQVTLSGRAVYQSEVPKLPIEMPGFSPPEVARDQYEIALGVEQLLFDAGRTSAQREVARAFGSLEQARVEVQIHDYLQRADAAYFGALLQNTAVEVLHSHREELLLRRRMLTARRESGLLTGGEIDELDVQVLELDQRLAEARGLQVAALQALGVLTGLDIAPDAVLEAPVVDASPEAGQGLRRSTTPGEDASFADRPGLARPENRVFELQRDRLKRQVAVAARQQHPTVFGFGSAAYGRPPGMNIFENDLSPYFSAGLRLRWPVWDRGSVRRERRTAELRQALVDAEQDAFLQSVEVEAAEIRADIERLHRAIDQDAQILQFRERLAQRAADQLENGTISVTDYLIHQEAVHRARLNEKRHRLELTFAHIRYRNTLGDHAAN